MRRLLFTLLAIAALAFAAWYFVSPWWTMKQIVDAADAGDTAALERLIDFDQLRSSMREDLAASREDGDRDLLDRIGDEIVRGAGNIAIDAAVNPRGLALLVDGSAMVPEGLQGQELSWSVDHEGITRFNAVSTWEDGTPGPVMLFRLDGSEWIMTGVRLG